MIADAMHQLAQSHCMPANLHCHFPEIRGKLQRFYNCNQFLSLVGVVIQTHKLDYSQNTHKQDLGLQFIMVF